MNLTPRTDRNDFTARRDVAEVSATTLSEMAEFKAEISEFRADLAEFRTDLLRTLGTWLFASQAIIIAWVALLLVVRD